MGIGISIFLIAVGAILAFAVNVTTQGIDLNMVGVILMVVGGVGLLFTALVWDRIYPWRRNTTEYVERDVIEHDRPHHHV